jgi:iron complex outermembrane receptor protein
VRNVPGAKSLSIDIANRWTQFKREGIIGNRTVSAFVHNSSGCLNIRWQVINDLLLRASWSQGFRSPNINDLFGGIGRPFIAFTDPCAPPPQGGYTGGALPPNCPGGTLDVQPTRFIIATGGSNPNVQPESSISRTLGFVYSPSQVPGLDVSADYFKIELTGAIGTVGFQNIVDGCFNNSSFCNLITARGGRVQDIRNVLTNVGALLPEGIDFGLHYKFPSTPFGDFGVRINGTYLATFDQTQVNRATQTGFATSHLAGTGSHPNMRLNGRLNWSYGNWSAHYRLEYIGDVVERCGVTEVEGYCSSLNSTTNFQGAPGQFPFGRQHLGTTVYHDVNVAYTVPSINTTFALGVNNLFDKKPPIGGGGGIDPHFYRRPSRLVYGSIRVRF